MTALIERLRERLARHEVPYELRPDGIRVSSASSEGYEIDVAAAGSQATVTLGGGWHEHFDASTEADHVEQLVMLALTDAARLKVTSRGSFAYAWTLETRVDGVWGRAGTTGVLVFPFWKRKRQTIFVNSRVEVSDLVPLIPERFLARAGG